MMYVRILTIVAMTIIGPCKAQNETQKLLSKFGGAFNTERLKRGIYPLPENGIVKNKYDWLLLTWLNPRIRESGIPKKPCWISKASEMKDGVLVQETDAFTSGKSFLVGDKTVLEVLAMKYSFADEKLGKNAWKCWVNCGPHIGMRTPGEAMQVLQDWGIAYFPPPKGNREP